MAQITGSDAKVGLKVATTWGTATQAGAADGLEVDSITFDEGVEQLTTNPIGSGNVMLDEATRGRVAPTTSMAKTMHYNDAGNVALAELFGGASLMDMGTSNYCQSILINETAHQKFITIASQIVGGSAVENATAACTQATISGTVPGYVKTAFDFIADVERVPGTTNTYTTLESATLADTERVVIQPDDELLIGPSTGGALASPANRVNFTSFTITHQRPAECPSEAKGSAGASSPVATGLYGCTLSVTCRVLNDADYQFLTGAQAGTAYKATITVTGSAATRKVVFAFPKLVLLKTPAIALTDVGNNPVTLEFTGLYTSTSPTGMISGYPYILIYNNRSTALLA